MACNEDYIPSRFDFRVFEPYCFAKQPFDPISNNCLPDVPAYGEPVSIMLNVVRSCAEDGQTI